MTAGKVRIPKQKRSADMKKKIKVTAQELFSEKGYYNTSSNEIVRAAGSSIGAFYSYFSDKKALFIEILHEYNQNIVAQVQVKTIQEDDPKLIISQYIRAVLDAHSYSPELHREILAMTYADKEIRDIVAHYEMEMVNQIVQLLNENRNLIRVTDINHAAYLIFKSVEEVVHSIRIFAYSCDESALIRELTDMICLYVLKRNLSVDS